MERRDKIGRSISDGYTEEFKRRVIKEYLRTGESKLAIQKRHGIKFKSAIVTWMKKLGYEDIHQKRTYFEELNSFILAQTFSMSKKSKEGAKEQSAELEKRIKELEKALEDEKLRSEALKLTIEIAERELKIAIRKK